MPKEESPETDDPSEIIAGLSHADALSVLRTLADHDARIARRIVKIAREALGSVDPEAIAAELFDELDALEVEEVWERAGKKRDGYVEPGEAYYVFEEAMGPFLETLRKYQRLGSARDTARYCAGLLTGLYRFEHESVTEFKHWAPDAPFSFAQDVMGTWQKSKPSPAATAALDELVAEMGGWTLSELQ